MNYLLVVNPIAGGTDKEPFLEVARQIARDEGIGYEILFTTGDQDETRLRELMERLRPQRVAAVGGDGTVHLVSTVLRDHPARLGIIPLGSANALARELQLSTDPEQSLRTFFFSDRTLLMDTILINDNYHCIHFADIGINAELVKDYEQDEGRGMMTYAKYFVRRVQDARRSHFRIRADDRDFDRTAFVAAVANGRRLGTNVLMNPCGGPDDGLLALVLIQEVYFEDFLKALVSTVNLEVEYGEGIECIPCREVSITLDSPRALQIDGEWIGEVERVTARVLPRWLEVVLPEEE